MYVCVCLCVYCIIKVKLCRVIRLCDIFNVVLLHDRKFPLITIVLVAKVLSWYVFLNGHRLRLYDLSEMHV